MFSSSSKVLRCYFSTVVTLGSYLSERLNGVELSGDDLSDRSLLATALVCFNEYSPQPDLRYSEPGRPLNEVSRF